MLHRHSIMYAVLNSRHAFFPCFYFVTYIVSMTLILTNMLVGVVLDSTAGFSATIECHDRGARRAPDAARDPRAPSAWRAHAHLPSVLPSPSAPVFSSSKQRHPHLPTTPRPAGLQQHMRHANKQAEMTALQSTCHTSANRPAYDDEDKGGGRSGRLGLTLRPSLGRRESSRARRDDEGSSAGGRGSAGVGGRGSDGTRSDAACAGDEEQMLHGGARPPPPGPYPSPRGLAQSHHETSRRDGLPRAVSNHL